MQQDSQLVQACRQGKVEAYTNLIDRYRYQVYGICLGFIRDFDVAEDAAQETFITAFLQLPSLSNPKQFGPWLRRIAINECKQWHRRQKPTIAMEDAGSTTWADPAPLPDEHMTEIETRKEVLNAIARLTEPQQQAITLFYMEELSLQQIADFLGTSLQTVNQRLYRARLRLKEEMIRMTKHTLGKQKLPPDFTEKVIQEIMQQATSLLEAQQWAKAREDFGKITDIIPDHIAANRGLALAYGGEVTEQLRAGQIDDSILVKTAFKTLDRAYKLGSVDDEIVQSLGKLYSRYGRNRDGGQFLEDVAEKQPDWQGHVRILKQAIAHYYHSYYKGGEDNMEACVRCHRRIIALVPDDIEPRRRLDIWRPAGVSLAYPHLGLADEVFSQLDALKEAVEAQWNVEDYFQWTLAYDCQYRELKEWDRTIEVGQKFVAWAKALPENDPRIYLNTLNLIDAPQHSESDENGPWKQWWTICVVLSSTIARAEQAAGLDSSETMTELDQVLGQHEAHYRSIQQKTEHTPDDTDLQSQAVKEKKRLAGSYTYAGEAAHRTGQYAVAICYYDREEELTGGLYGHSPLRLAASLVAEGNIDRAKSCLRAISGRMVTNGQYRAFFEEFQEFDPIRHDPEVVTVINHWIQAEAVGQEEKPG